MKPSHFPWFALLPILVAGLVAADAPQPQPTGQIVGRVRYTGVVPPPKEILTTDGATLRHSDLLVDPKTKGLRYVVAVLEDTPAQPKAKGAKPVVVDQRDMVFVPRVVAVLHGQRVRFDNSDQCNHAVMALSPLPANEFNLSAGPGQSIEHAFESQKTPVVIGCTLHPWMRAWVHVASHPWFAVSDPEGRFTIAAVPPGKYTLLLTHPDTGLRERRTVEVRAGKATAVEVEWSKTK